MRIRLLCCSPPLVFTDSSPKNVSEFTSFQKRCCRKNCSVLTHQQLSPKRTALLSSSFNLGGSDRRQFRLDGGDFLPDGFRRAVSV